MVQLLSIDKKAELKRFTNSLTILKSEFAALILNCAQFGYLHQMTYHIREPEHLQLKVEDFWAMGKYKPGDMLDEKDQKSMRKTTQLGRDRRLMTAHLFVAPARWHIFYFDQR